MEEDVTPADLIQRFLQIVTTNANGYLESYPTAHHAENMEKIISAKIEVIFNSLNKFY